MIKAKKTKRWVNCGNDVSVLYNENWSEFDIHSRLYFRLSVAFPDYHVKTETLIKCGKMSVIADIMIFNKLVPICAIEVKKAKIQQTPQDQKQLKTYNEMTEIAGIPIFYCQGFNDIKPTFHRVYNHLIEKHGLKRVSGVVK